MDKGGFDQDKPEAEGVGQRLRQGQGLQQALQALFGIAEPPEHKGHVAPAIRAGVPAIAKGVGAVLLRVVEGNGLLQMLLGLGQPPAPTQALAQRPVGLQEEGRIALLLGQAQELLGQLPGRVVISTGPDNAAPGPQSREDFSVSPSCWHSSRARV